MRFIATTTIKKTLNGLGSQTGLNLGLEDGMAPLQGEEKDHLLGDRVDLGGDQGAKQLLQALLFVGPHS